MAATPGRVVRAGNQAVDQIVRPHAVSREVTEFIAHDDEVGLRLHADSHDVVDQRIDDLISRDAGICRCRRLVEIEVIEVRCRSGTVDQRVAILDRKLGNSDLVRGQESLRRLDGRQRLTQILIRQIN